MHGHRRKSVRTEMEACLRDSGWKLREIVEVIEGINRDHPSYARNLENLRKRLAAMRVRRAPGTGARPPDEEWMLDLRLAAMAREEARARQPRTTKASRPDRDS